MADTDAAGDEVPDWLQTEEEPAVVEIPDWLQEHTQTAVVEAEAAGGDLPDWLAEAGLQEDQLNEEIPDWLLETIEEEQVSVTAQEAGAAEPTADPVAPTPPPQALQPVPASPAPVMSSNIDVAATLQSAKEKLAQGEVERSLQDYEAVVHANAQLDVVVSDLGELVKDERYKNNAGVDRVLGDGLMRQGRLQDALDTYRRALNLL